MPRRRGRARGRRGASTSSSSSRNSNEAAGRKKIKLEETEEDEVSVSQAVAEGEGELAVVEGEVVEEPVVQVEEPEPFADVDENSRLFRIEHPMLNPLVIFFLNS